MTDNIMLFHAGGLYDLDIHTVCQLNPGSLDSRQARRLDGVQLAELLWTHFPYQTVDVAILAYFRHRCEAMSAPWSKESLKTQLNDAWRVFMAEAEDEFDFILDLAKGEGK